MTIKAKNNSGFTIVELLIVIVVIGILAAITIVSYNGIQKRARTIAATAAVDQWEKIIRSKIAETGELTTTPVYACLVPSEDDLPKTNNFPQGSCLALDGENFIGTYSADFIDKIKSSQDIPKINFPTTRVSDDNLTLYARAPIAIVSEGNISIVWYPETAGDCGRGKSALLDPVRPEIGATCTLTIEY